jgi:hypothetical protein
MLHLFLCHKLVWPLLQVHVYGTFTCAVQSHVAHMYAGQSRVLYSLVCACGSHVRRTVTCAVQSCVCVWLTRTVCILKTWSVSVSSRQKCHVCGDCIAMCPPGHCQLQTLTVVWLNVHFELHMTTQGRVQRVSHLYIVQCIHVVCTVCVGENIMTNR